MPNAAEIREMTTGEILQALNEAKAELLALRFEQETSQLKNSARVRVVRRDVARYKTILRERQLAAEVVRATLNEEDVEDAE